MTRRALHLARWRKNIAEWLDEDDERTVNISVVFTWDEAQAYSRAVWWHAQGYQVRVGGPGVYTLKKDFTGIAEVGGNMPDTVRRHNPDATFSSHGCPVGCYFCIVPAMEGREFTLLDSFVPRPILCDNNLSALPDDWQNEVVKRYQRRSIPLLDANSGFEPRTFDQAVLRRWEAVNFGPWRFAYDETSEGQDVERVCRMLTGYPPNRKRVYVLLGNEPFQACMDRILQVIAWGCEPHCQPVMKLNVRTREFWIRHDWTPALLRDVARWANRKIWRKCSFQDYRPDYGRLLSANSPPPTDQLPLLIRHSPS